MAGKFLAPQICTLAKIFGVIVISKLINKINNYLIFIMVGIIHNQIILVALMPR